MQSMAEAVGCQSLLKSRTQIFLSPIRALSVVLGHVFSSPCSQTPQPAPVPLLGEAVSKSQTPVPALMWLVVVQGGETIM